MRRQNWLLRLAAAYALVTFLALAIAVLWPTQFQKYNTVRPGGGSGDLATAPALDVEDFLGSIPYGDGAMVWEVLPAKKYERTIVEGFGNCANLVFGAAYYLSDRDIDYEIVHFLDREEFSDGVGHTVVRAPYALDGQTVVGIVDILEGAVPRSGGKPADARDLETGQSIQMQPMTALRDDESPYYGDFLTTSERGFITRLAIERYFEFVERAYVPLGSPRLEKLTFDGLSLLFGSYPMISVPNYDALLEGHQLRFLIFTTTLWVLRGAAVFFPMLALVWMGRALTHRLQ